MYQAQGAAVAFIPPAGAGALRASFVSPLQPQAFGLRLPLRHELGSDRTAHARRPSVANACGGRDAAPLIYLPTPPALQITADARGRGMSPALSVYQEADRYLCLDHRHEMPRHLRRLGTMETPRRGSLGLLSVAVSSRPMAS